MSITDLIVKQFENNAMNEAIRKITKNKNRYNFNIDFNDSEYIDARCSSLIQYFDIDKFLVMGILL